MITYKVNPESALLEPVIYRASPHHDHRSPEVVIDMIVLHGISLPPRQFGTDTVEAFFCGHVDIEGLRVSSHLFIKRTGEVMQFVPFHKRAWHAGVSAFQGRTGCNDFSIGIELEGTDDIPYEEEQYRQLCAIIPALKQAYPAITRERIVGHVDIAPGRKTDPGPAFDWTCLNGIII